MCLSVDLGTGHTSRTARPFVVKNDLNPSVGGNGPGKSSTIPLLGGRGKLSRASQTASADDTANQK